MNVSNQPPRSSIHPKLSIPHPPEKFLMRTLRNQNLKSNALRAVCVKRLYLKNVVPQSINDNTKSKEIFYRYFKNNKLCKTLKCIHIYSISHSYAYECLKNAKNLRKVTLSIGDLAERMGKIVRFINRLPVSMQTVIFSIQKEEPTVNQDIYRIAKSIRYLPKLENFYRTFYFDSVKDHVKKELRIYSQIFRKLKNMKRKTYILGPGEYSSFKQAMRSGLIYPGITGLELNLSQTFCGIFPDLGQDFNTDESSDIEIQSDFDDLPENERNAYKVIQNFIQSEDQKQEDANLKSKDFSENELSGPVSLQFVENCIRREEMKTFYSFSRFPDLKMLCILQFDRLCPLGSYVVDGFAALKNLYTLIISITERSLNTGYIFKGLQKLPLLKACKMRIPFIKNQEWDLLRSFLKDQRDLEELLIYLHIHRTASKTRYLQQNASLQAMIQDLKNKSSLKTLDLRADYWSLEAISKGFASLSMMNQLQILRLKASDDTVFSQEELQKRVEGLCNFIKNQSESLVELYIALPCVLEDNIVTHIAEAISKLNRLRDFGLLTNLSWKDGVDDVQKYYQETLQSEISASSRIMLKRSNKWNPSLANYLEKVINLELFTLDFDIADRDSTAWILDLVKILPNFPKLRKIFLATRSRSLTKHVERELISIVQELKNIRKIVILWGDKGEDGSVDTFKMPANSPLKDIIDKIHQKQDRRCDLMF